MPETEEKRPSRTTCGILALLVGWAGLHKFMMGHTNAALLHIAAVWCTCGFGGIISLIEGIKYLTMTDEEFYQTYIVGGKEWF